MRHSAERGRAPATGRVRSAAETREAQTAAPIAGNGEIEARATRLSQASNDQIVLAADGALRWTGDLVGKLMAGDDTLRPRVRIIADEHLTGPARELVQTRLDLWLKTHIEKLLAPLFSLTAAEDVTGMARGVAFQLVESLGVLERQKVAEEVKGLDQPARATLRKYGVRFGAYHVYLPALLKPAPRALATQLWAIKHENPEAKGVGDLLHLAASGRTSIPVDKDTPKALYRTAGYRICGERAVRVDILERLADLIRPALSWREGAPGPKPDSVFDGRSFLVTGAMTSLTGASGEDFASILRSLGYRMDRKPKPVEPTVSVPAATDATAPADVAEATGTASEVAPASTAAAPSESAPVEATSTQATEETIGADLPSRSLLPEPEFLAPGAAPLVQDQMPATEEAAKPKVVFVEAVATAPASAASSGERPCRSLIFRKAGSRRFCVSMNVWLGWFSESGAPPSFSSRWPGRPQPPPCPPIRLALCPLTNSIKIKLRSIAPRCNCRNISRTLKKTGPNWSGWWGLNCPGRPEVRNEPRTPQIRVEPGIRGGPGPGSPDHSQPFRGIDLVPGQGDQEGLVLGLPQEPQLHQRGAG